MRLEGILKTWNDDRGFGFIEPRQGGQELFVHIKSFPPGTGRPSVGQALTFEVETSPNGNKRARGVQYPARPRSHRSVRQVESPAPWTLPRLIVIPAFIAACGYVAMRFGFRPGVLVAYLVMSTLAFIGYAVDKSAAIAGRWRTPESTLHMLSLAGGWPGALLAQQLLRHKTSKPSFVGTFWFTVAVNSGACLALQSGMVRLPGL